MTEYRVKTTIKAIYDNAGYRETSKAGNDPDAKVNMERESRKLALAHLPMKDRVAINDCTKRLKECSAGCNLGDGAALQILMHLGIFLSRAERY